MRWGREIVVASIAKVGRVHAGSGSGVGLDYYLSYVERGGEPGRWLGAGADRLGLAGHVAAAEPAGNRRGPVARR
jgi:hypothetical protein